MPEEVALEVLTYAGVIEAIEKRAENPARLNFMIAEVVGCSYYPVELPDLSPTGQAMWTLPDGARLVTSVVMPPDFLGSIDIAKHLVPEGRAWSISVVPNQNATAIVIAAPTHDGPGYVGKGDGAAALVIAALRARKGIGGLV